MNVLEQVIENKYAIYNGDSCEIVRAIPDNSIHYTIFSPPFASLYTYSNSDRDMGNSKGMMNFTIILSFLQKELYRVTMPGRLLSFHCMDPPLMKERDGVIGLKDFPAIIRKILKIADLFIIVKSQFGKIRLLKCREQKHWGCYISKSEKTAL